MGGMTYKPPTDIGMLRSIAAAQKPIMTSDGQGGQSTEWVPDFEFFCAVDWYRGNEVVIADRLTFITTAMLSARWDPRLTTSHRIILQQISGGIVSRKFLNVRVVTNYQERNQWMSVRGELGVGN